MRSPLSSFRDYSTVQVSPPMRTPSRSPCPLLAIAAAICSSIRRSGRPGDRPQDADGDRERRPEHARQHEGEVRLFGLLIVDEDVVLGDAVLADRDDFRVESG
jgi:hypothetical protein